MNPDTRCKASKHVHAGKIDRFSSWQPKSKDNLRRFPYPLPFLSAYHVKQTAPMPPCKMSAPFGHKVAGTFTSAASRGTHARSGALFCVTENEDSTAGMIKGLIQYYRGNGSLLRSCSSVDRPSRDRSYQRSAIRRRPKGTAAGKPPNRSVTDSKPDCRDGRI